MESTFRKVEDSWITKKIELWNFFLMALAAGTLAPAAMGPFCDMAMPRARYQDAIRKQPTTAWS
jgi:hypothetical protein